MQSKPDIRYSASLPWVFRLVPQRQKFVLIFFPSPVAFFSCLRSLFLGTFFEKYITAAGKVIK